MDRLFVSWIARESGSNKFTHVGPWTSYSNTILHFYVLTTKPVKPVNCKLNINTIVLVSKISKAYRIQF